MLSEYQIDTMDFTLNRCNSDITYHGSRHLLAEINSNANLRVNANIINNVAKGILKGAVDNKWKKIFWEKSSVEPALLR